MEVIKSIIANKTPVYFISPHFDDAILSAGELIYYLSDKTVVTVVTVFAKAGKEKHTFSAAKALRNSGFYTVEELYTARQQENKKALSPMHVHSFDLPFVEALWRQYHHPNKIRNAVGRIFPECIHLYPIYNIHILSNHIAHQDYSLSNDIHEYLGQIIPSHAVIFCPMGIGNHIDHIIVRKAVEGLRKSIYWIDQPYGMRNNYTIPSAFTTISYQSKESFKMKKQLLTMYQTQIHLLFPSGDIPTYKEYYAYKP
jgi:LmbE family N-acetylglucosaminyl deacetylase